MLLIGRRGWLVEVVRLEYWSYLASMAAPSLSLSGRATIVILDPYSASCFPGPWCSQRPVSCLSHNDLD